MLELIRLYRKINSSPSALSLLLFISHSLDGSICYITRHCGVHSHATLSKTSADELQLAYEL